MFLYKKMSNVDFSCQKKKNENPNKVKYYYVLPIWINKNGDDVIFIYNYNLITAEDYNNWSLDNKITLNRSNRKHCGFFNQRSFKIVHLKINV